MDEIARDVGYVVISILFIAAIVALLFGVTVFFGWLIGLAARRPPRR